MEPRERKGKLVQKLIIAAVAAIVGVSIVLVIISSVSINNTYDEMVQEEAPVVETVETEVITPVKQEEKPTTETLEEKPHPPMSTG